MGSATRSLVKTDAGPSSREVPAVATVGQPERQEERGSEIRAPFFFLAMAERLFLVAGFSVDVLHELQRILIARIEIEHPARTTHRGVV